jgi:hypothetical protein
LWTWPWTFKFHIRWGILRAWATISFLKWTLLQEVSELICCECTALYIHAVYIYLQFLYYLASWKYILSHVC